MTILIVLDKAKAICFDVAQTQFPETKQKGQYRRRLRGSWILLRPPSQFLFASEPCYHNLDAFSVWTYGLFFFLPFSSSTKGLIKEHEGRGSSAQNCRLRAPLYFEDNGSRPGNLPGLWADFTASAHVSTVDVIPHLWGGGVAGFFRPVQTPERMLAQKV